MQIKELINGLYYQFYFVSLLYIYIYIYIHHIS